MGLPDATMTTEKNKNLKIVMPDQAISLSQLESHLWESANILRGPVDAADFKSYVFPLLFFKRLSDVHDEEHAAALKEFDGDEESALFPENYRFQIPEDCHWRDVRKVATNVGQALQTAMRGIEQANPHTLYGIFGDAQWTNKDRLSDSLLRDLIEHFSLLSLGNSAAKADVLGQSYEYLIKKFADTTNKKAGEFYTPRSIVRLMVNTRKRRPMFAKPVVSPFKSVTKPGCWNTATGRLLPQATVERQGSTCRRSTARLAGVVGRTLPVPGNLPHTGRLGQPPRSSHSRTRNWVRPGPRKARHLTGNGCLNGVSSTR